MLLKSRLDYVCIIDGVVLLLQKDDVLVEGKLISKFLLSTSSLDEDGARM